MSAHVTIGGVALRVAAPNVLGVQWVRRHDGPETGRALGVLARVNAFAGTTAAARPRMVWRWTVSALAFRPPARRVGEIPQHVPAHLFNMGEEKTRDLALGALVAWLRENRAPVLDYGPHPDVTMKEVV